MWVYVALFVVITLAPLDVPRDIRTLIGDAGLLPGGLVVALLAARAGLRRGAAPPTRRAWLWLSVAFLAFWLGDLLYFYYEVVARSSPSPSLADVSYLTYYPLLLIGLVSFPRVLRTRAERVRFGIDAVTVALGGAMVVWYFALGPIVSAEQTDPVQTLLAVAYPVGDLVLLLGIGFIAARSTTGLSRRAVALLMSGLVVSLAADLSFGIQIVNGTFEAGDLADTLYMLAWGLLAGAAYYAAVSTNRRRSADSRSVAPDSVPLLPYLSVALGYGMLVTGVGQQWSPTTGGLVIGAGCLTALVIARQVSSVRQNLRLAAQHATHRTEARFRSLVQNASDVIMVVGREGYVTYVTPSVSRMLGYALRDVVGLPFRDFIEPDDRRLADDLLAAVVDVPNSHATYELRLARRDGRPLVGEVSAVNLVEDADIGGSVVTIRNVDDRKKLEVKLAHQAYHDPLTGLANRSLFMSSAAAEMLRGRELGYAVGLLYIDVDSFKMINDSLGHRSGDRALVEVGKRIRHVLRGGDELGRVGGDEFCVLLSGPATIEAASVVCERIQEALAVPFALAGLEITFSVSIGICLTDSADQTPDDLLRNADIAMYLAKTRGKAGFAVFEEGMQLPAREKLDLGVALRHALTRGEFEVFYQPIFELASGKAVGSEALIRWRRDGRELLLPGKFIGYAEETGQIVAIGLWTLEQVCSKAAEQSPGARGSAKGRRHAPFVAVNVSARQLDDLRFVSDVDGVLSRTGLDPARLVLEVTESMTMIQPELTIERLRALKELGLEIAIDDFGTGYSSLGYLRRLPVDKVKIDRSFIADMDRAAGAALVSGIVNLARSLGLKCVAEGIETGEQAAALRELGCELGQGFFYGRPAPWSEVSPLFQT
jgi:diguanylate cyclase (GGDEF)-like protein/PAS domain S-box-containing protein